MRKHDKYIEHYPNDETIQVIRDIEAGNGIISANSFTEVLEMAGIHLPLKTGKKKNKWRH